MSQVNELVSTINRSTQMITNRLDQQNKELRKLQNGLRAVVMVMLFPVLIAIAVVGYVAFIRMAG